MVFPHELYDGSYDFIDLMPPSLPILASLDALNATSFFIISVMPHGLYGYPLIQEASPSLACSCLGGVSLVHFEGSSSRATMISIHDDGASWIVFQCNKKYHSMTVYLY